MEKAILLAVTASLCTATSSVCQRKGARSSPAAGFDLRVVFRLARQLRVIGLLSSYTLSEARMANDAARAAAEAAAGTAAAPGWSYEALLRELANEQTYPRLHRLAWSADPGGNPAGFEEREEFLFGLDAILDGVQALIDRSKAAGAQ